MIVFGRKNTTAEAVVSCPWGWRLLDVKGLQVGDGVRYVLSGHA
jgi:hypothetical protein